MTSRSYSELIRLDTFEDRFRYLQLSGFVGVENEADTRWIHQDFYSSREWKRIRDEVLIRDNGMDLGLPGYPIFGPIFVHHMNPISDEDILAHSAAAINPEYLICVSKTTHNALHYGSFDMIARDPIERRPNDTCPWKKVLQ